jgi:hypothetical protein
MSKETNEEKPFEGFNILAGDTMVPQDNLEIKDLPDGESLGDDTGIEDKTEAPEKKTESKSKEAEELSSDNLEIQYKELEEEPEEKDEDSEEIKAEETPKEEVSDEAPSEIAVVANFLREEGIVDYTDEDFEDSEEGLAKVVENQIKKGIEKYKDSLDPTSKEFINYVEQGGDPQHFVRAHSDVDFNRIDKNSIEKNENMQKQLVAELMRREGYSQEEIIDEVQDLLDGGVLAKRASRSLTKLQKHQQTERANLVKEQQKANEQKEVQYKEFLTNLETDITKREEIAGFPISKKQKKDFYEYITKTDRKTGKTKLVADSEKDPDAQLKMAWLYFNNFDFSKVEKKARTKATSSLRKSLERASSVSTKKLKSKSRTRSSEDVDFSLFQKAIK